VINRIQRQMFLELPRHQPLLYWSLENPEISVIVWPLGKMESRAEAGVTNESRPFATSISNKLYSQDVPAGQNFLLGKCENIINISRCSFPRIQDIGYDG
jgi:hypothetical protein